MLQGRNEFFLLAAKRRVRPSGQIACFARGTEKPGGSFPGILFTGTIGPGQFAEATEASREPVLV